MRAIFTILLMALPILAFAQAARAQVKRTNPPTLSTPTGYTHVVEVAGAARTVYIAGQIRHS